FLAGPHGYGQSRFPFDFERETPMDYAQVECARGEDIMGRGVSLQMTPNISAEAVETIISTVRKTTAAYLSRR
ncbi:MAG: hypothetical protein OXP73_10310, partial [Chloroflexota bacterium]|nr:hypothetical protein [Chloroflexota bacterium]